MLKNKKFIVLVLFLFVIFIFLIYHLSFYQTKKINEFKVSAYYDTPNKEDFYGILKIAKLNINNLIYKRETKNNNVNKNIYLAYHENDSLIVLASHSGDSPISYFKNLHLLGESTNIELIINNTKRTYRLFKKIEVLKTGNIEITKYNYPVLVLITCSKTNNKIQEVYYTRLVKSANFS